jgi:hypothetical protein
MARRYVAIHLNVNRACKTIFRRCVNELAEYRIFISPLPLGARAFGH